MIVSLMGCVTFPFRATFARVGSVYTILSLLVLTFLPFEVQKVVLPLGVCVSGLVLGALHSRGYGRRFGAQGSCSYSVCVFGLVLGALHSPGYGFCFALLRFAVLQLSGTCFVLTPLSSVSTVSV